MNKAAVFWKLSLLNLTENIPLKKLIQTQLKLMVSPKNLRLRESLFSAISFPSQELGEFKEFFPFRHSSTPCKEEKDASRPRCSRSSHPALYCLPSKRNGLQFSLNLGVETNHSGPQIADRWSISKPKQWHELHNGNSFSSCPEESINFGKTIHDTVISPQIQWWPTKKYQSGNSIKTKIWREN